MNSLFDDQEDSEAPSLPFVPKPPRPFLTFQEYESQGAANRHLSVAEYRAWLKNKGYQITRCLRACGMPFCQGWQLADLVERDE